MSAAATSPQISISQHKKSCGGQLPPCSDPGFSIPPTVAVPWRPLQAARDRKGGCRRRSFPLFGRRSDIHYCLLAAAPGTSAVLTREAHECVGNQLTRETPCMRLVHSIKSKVTSSQIPTEIKKTKASSSPMPGIKAHALQMDSARQSVFQSHSGCLADRQLGTSFVVIQRRRGGLPSRLFTPVVVFGSRQLCQCHIGNLEMPPTVHTFSCSLWNTKTNCMSLACY